MASAILHIKDCFYFEVPKFVWPVQHASKADFPAVWVRLDPEFQLWEAQRLYENYLQPHYRPQQGDSPSFEALKSAYVAWKEQHANAGKPFAEFLPQHDKEWFTAHLQNPENAAAWERAVAEARDVAGFQRDDRCAGRPRRSRPTIST